MPSGVYKRTDEHRNRLSGHAPWNKGLSAEMDERVKKSTDAAHKAVKGRTPWNKGKTGVSDETKEKMRKAKLGKPSKRGGRKSDYCKEKHHWWKGGATEINDQIRSSLEYRLWRLKIFTRDDWTCKKCLERGSRLRAHHIWNFAEYKELRFEVSNGITFCKRCHDIFHSIFGTKHNTEQQVIKFLNDKNYAIKNGEVEEDDWF